MVYIHAIHMESNTDPTIAGSREESIKMDSRRDCGTEGKKTKPGYPDNLKLIDDVLPTCRANS